ncbi:hypothetical protein BB560_002505 [Smittium megazygosporum]|uniref:Uncharacterized protein n=1 Tax=Smittium megazygosporum TaxID=133381 RepID=A0A2T9ZEL1_9FUNG|nr:hypothetical protein BB560_002505 [Smittium megazygosporum]
MENNRKLSMIKNILAIESRTIKELHGELIKRFPEDFKGLSLTQLKRKHLKKLKELKEIVAKPVSDPEIFEKKKELGFTNPTQEKRKVVWLLKISNNLKSKYENMKPEEFDKVDSKVLDFVEEEKKKGEDFWNGASSTPHDWKKTVSEKHGNILETLKESRKYAGGY